MKKALILFLLVLPLLAMAVIPESSLIELLGNEQLNQLNGKTIHLRVTNKKTDKSILHELQKYLIKNEVIVMDTSHDADYQLVVDNTLIKKSINIQGNSRFMNITLKCVSNVDNRVIFVTNSEVPSDTIHLKSGLRFKWYEPILFAVAIGSLVFGLWNLN